MNLKRWLCWLVFVLAAGCAPSVRWLREDIHPKGVTGDRQLDHAKIWSAGSLVEWRAVVVKRDSISGIPYALSGCDSCRLALPVSAVDSLSVGYDMNRIAKSDGEGETPVWLPLLLLALVLCP